MSKKNKVEFNGPEPVIKKPKKNNDTPPLSPDAEDPIEEVMEDPPKPDDVDAPKVPEWLNYYPLYDDPEEQANTTARAIALIGCDSHCYRSRRYFDVPYSCILETNV